MNKVKLILFLLMAVMVSSFAQNNVSIAGLGDIPYIKNENKFTLDLHDYGTFDFTGTIQPLNLSTEASIDQLTNFPGYNMMSKLGLDSIMLEASIEGLKVKSTIDTKRNLKPLFDALKISAPTMEVTTKIGKGTFELEGELAFPDPIELVHIDNPGTVFKFSSIALGSSAEAGSLDLQVTTGLMIKPSNVDPELETYFTFGYNLITQELKGAGSYMTQWIDPFGINTFVNENSIILNGGALEIGYIPGSPTPTKIGIAIKDAILFDNQFTAYISVAPADKQIGLYATRVDEMTANDMAKILREGFGLKVPNIFPECYSLTNSVIQFSPTKLEVGEYDMEKGFELSGDAKVCGLMTGDFNYYFDMEDQFVIHADFDVDAKRFLMNEARKVGVLAATVNKMFENAEIKSLYVDMNGSLKNMNMAGETKVKMRVMDQDFEFKFAATLDPNAIASNIFYKLQDEFPGVFNAVGEISKRVKSVAGPAVTASIDIAQQGFDKLGNFAGHVAEFSSHATHGSRFSNHPDCFSSCVPNRANDLREPIFHASNRAVLEFYSQINPTIIKLIGTSPAETSILRANAIKADWYRLVDDLEHKWNAIFYDDLYKGFDKDPGDVTRYGNEYRRIVNERYQQHVKLRNELWKRLMTNGSSTVQIYNRWKPGQALHHENTIIASGNIQQGWISARWMVEPVIGSPEYIRIKNAHKGTYLHIENGKVEAGEIAPEWHSAQWKIESVPGTEFVRLRNRWKGTLLNIETGSLTCSDIGDGAFSAMWDIKPVNNLNKEWNLNGDRTWKPGETVLQSTNGVYSMIFQTDGNLVLYRNGNEVKWTSNTANKEATGLRFQKDGNLVVFNEKDVLWAANCHGRNGEALSLENSGEVVVHAPGSKVIWSTVGERAWSNLDTKTWIPGETVLRSKNGQYRLDFQKDGNLVILQKGNGIWYTGSHWRGATQLRFQKDGNFFIRTSPDHAEWSANSHGQGGETLFLQDDGNLVIHAPGAVVIWASGSHGTAVVHNTLVRLKNRHKNGYIHIEHGPVRSENIGPGSHSCQWVIEPSGEGNYVRIKNRWKGTYLNTENDGLQCTAIDPNWDSAKWELYEVDGKYVKIRNKWKSDRYIHHEWGLLECQTIEQGWYSAMWEIEYVE